MAGAAIAKIHSKSSTLHPSRRARLLRSQRLKNMRASEFDWEGGFGVGLGAGFAAGEEEEGRGEEEEEPMWCAQAVQVETQAKIIMNSAEAEAQKGVQIRVVCGPEIRVGEASGFAFPADRKFGEPAGSHRGNSARRFALGKIPIMRVADGTVTHGAQCPRGHAEQDGEQEESADEPAGLHGGILPREGGWGRGGWGRWLVGPFGGRGGLALPDGRGCLRMRIVRRAWMRGGNVVCEGRTGVTPG
jgi:hypothetical protein